MIIDQLTKINPQRFVPVFQQNLLQIFLQTFTKANDHVKRYLIMTFKSWKGYFTPNNVLKLISDRTDIAKREKELFYEADPSDLQEYDAFVKEKRENHRNVPEIDLHFRVELSQPMDASFSTHQNMPLQNRMSYMQDVSGHDQVYQDYYPQDLFAIDQMTTQQHSYEDQIASDSYSDPLNSNNAYAYNSSILNNGFLGRGFEQDYSRISNMRKFSTPNQNMDNQNYIRRFNNVSEQVT